MAVDLSTLSAEDRGDFEKRLSVYGLGAQSVVPQLIVQRRSVVRLAHGPNRPSAVSPVVIRVNDFDTVKRMVGVDDHVVPSRGARVAIPPRLGGVRRGISSSADVRLAANRDMGARAPEWPSIAELGSDELHSIRSAARAFVRGDSRAVVNHKALIEAYIGWVDIAVFPIMSIKVESGSVLEFGSGMNVLVAYELEVEAGGKIRSEGHLVVSVTKLKKTNVKLAGLSPDLLAVKSVKNIYRP